MIRQKQRKTVEELYGGKSETNKSQVTTTTPISIQKTGRITERDYGYIISSNTPYSVPAVALNSAASKPFSAGKETSRRKSARASNKLANENFCGKEKFATDNLMQPTKGANANGYDNKNYGNCKNIAADCNMPQQHQHHNHQHKHRHNAGHDEDKDDDTDEFFELIRKTVESAIGKSISELLNRNFRDLASKVERFSNELKNTNALINQVKNEINNKIIHYGEENSRHFRYLCMKSEYDKMFYQHQTLIASTSQPSTNLNRSEIKKSGKRKSAPKLSSSAPKLLRNVSDRPSTSGSCTCRSYKCKTSTTDIKQPQIHSSEDISQKSSEVGMREVLDHIQKFCAQMQLNDFKCNANDERENEDQMRNSIRSDDVIKINREIFIEDDEVEVNDEEWEISSDEMTPRINENKNQNLSGSITARGAMTQRGNTGAGDG
ncbi:uncharacterized protein ACRADG_009931 [Cochliomyia hominivorax]